MFFVLYLFPVCTTVLSDLNQIRPNSVHVEPGDSSSAVDLLHMLNSLAKQTSDSKVKTAAETAALRVSDMILKAEFDGDPSDIDTTGMTGISILFPSFESEWATRSKGISEKRIWIHHIFRNSLLSIVTLIGIRFGTLIGGAVIVENVFAWPGLGRLVIESIHVRDITVVQAAVFWYSLSFIMINLVVDLLYSVVDPRVKIE